MTVTEIRNILESPYDRKVWKSFLQAQFTNNKLNAEDRTILLLDKTLSKQCLSLGNYEISDYSKIGIFEVELNEKVNISRNRVALRNLIKDITQQVAGAMVVFVLGDKWRFSYISKRKVKNTRTNEIEDKQTAPKRYTYLFGKNEKAKTAADRFYNLIEKQKANLFDLLSLDDFEEAFSVEKLSKEFFQNYKATYEDFVQFLTGKRYGKKGNKYVEQVIHEPNWQLTTLFNKDEKQARDFCKRMMGRIVFLYFIQKKGWLAVAQGKNWGEGNPDYLFHLFKKSKSKEDFYHEELVNLFFKTLNNPDSEKAKNEFRFPYLNGGLFDDSHDKKYNKLHLPEEVFSRMFETFNNYNFTVYEDAPDEHTVAVDPEMLGHIFENLLEDNKDKGAYYTPKEIVHYMCKESLKAYLYANDELHISENELAKITIDKIIQQQELGNDEKQFAEKSAYKIIDALDTLKICDPAIGSGAFPMGLLQEIFNAQIYLQELKGFKKGVTDADIKKHIIEESIYGVDIDAGAVDIARLRFWLSLVVDEVKPQPLPNLDFKIVCANTLIPTGYDKFIELAEKTQTPTLLRMDGEIQKLQSIRDRYFDESDRKTKDNLKIEFVQTRDYILLEFNSLKKSYALGDFLEKIKEWQPFEDTSCSWFDPWWMFGIKDGFDIVIGNPPYVFARGNSFTKDEKKFFYANYKLASYQINIYPLFIEKGNELLKQGGILSYIVPNNWLTLNTNKDLRGMILSKSDVTIVNFYAKVFENASVDSSIIVYSNTSSSNSKIKLLEFEKEFKLIKEEYADYFLNKPDYIINIETFKDNSFGGLLEEIESGSEILKSIAQVKTGLKAYQNGKGVPLQTDYEKDNRIFHSNKKVDSNYIKYLQGKDVKRYSLEWSGEYLNYGKHLAEPRNNFDLFFTERLLVRQIPSKPPYCINACFVNEIILNDINSMNVIYINQNPKYVLALLNSRLISFWFIHKFGKMQRGIFPQFKINELEIFPIKISKSSHEIKSVVALAEYLMFLYNPLSEQIIQHTTNERIASHIEEVLNMMVYELYFEEHMKENGIDVLQFINEKLKTQTEKSIAKQIEDFYLWYQKPENPVRQRMLLVETRSKDKIALINKSIQQ